MYPPPPTLTCTCDTRVNIPLSKSSPTPSCPPDPMSLSNEYASPIEPPHPHAYIRPVGVFVSMCFHPHATWYCEWVWVCIVCIVLIAPQGHTFVFIAHSLPHDHSLLLSPHTHTYTQQIKHPTPSKESPLSTHRIHQYIPSSWCRLPHDCWCITRPQPQHTMFVAPPDIQPTIATNSTSKHGGHGNRVQGGDTGDLYVHRGKGVYGWGMGVFERWVHVVGTKNLLCAQHSETFS